MKNLIAIILCLLNINFTMGQSSLKDPSFEEVLSLRSVGNPTISADGKMVAFTMRTADWEQNEFDNEIWISKNGGQAFQLTNVPKGSSISPTFSPDNKWLAFLSDRGGKNQIYVMRIEGGEAFAITDEKESIADLEWAPSGKKLFFIKPEKENKKKKDEEKRYGGFTTDDKEFNLSHLWQVDFNPALRNPVELPCYQSVDSLKSQSGCLELAKPERLTEGAYTVTSFKVSPDGTQIAFDHQPNPLINSFYKSDISLIDLTTKKIKSLVANASTRCPCRLVSRFKGIIIHHQRK